MGKLGWTQIILALIGLMNAYLAYQMKAYHNSVNSKMDEFHEIIKKAYLAKGIEQEKQRRGIQDIQDAKPKGG